VIRGEEWLPSAPLHILLYRAFGWEAPQFAHLPLLLKPEGNGKLSKRDGLLGDFPVFPLEWKDPATDEISRGFREDGYFPEAVLNFLALLGWNPGTEQEIMSIDELSAAFSLESIHKSGARFDVNKAKWFNQSYLRAKDDETLAALIADKLPAGFDGVKVAKLMKERVTFVSELVSEVPYLFEEPKVYDEEVATKKWDDLAKKAMPLIADALGKMSSEDFESAAIHDAIFAALEAAEIKPGKVMQALRLAVTGDGKGPDLMLVMEILGQASTVKRINQALEVLGK
jgi:glutamyl-tRNA synthetase